MKEKIKNLLSKKPIKVLIRVIGVLCTLFTIFILLIIALGSCSQKQYDYNANELNNKPQLIHKNMGVNSSYLYLLSYGELANKNVYDNMLYNLIQDASIESINFVTSNSWYNGRYFYFKADLIGQRALTTSYTKHRFRYDNNSIYFFAWDGSDHAYDCWGYKITRYPYDFINNSYIYSSNVYHFTYGGSNISSANIDLSYFNSNTQVSDLPNLGVSFEHYIVQPGDPDYPDGQENHFYTSTSFLMGNNYPGDYNSGYNNGFIAGTRTRSEADYNEGYTTGYNAGYELGIHQNNSTDLFSIIMQGFSAVSSLLNLSIMPGLSLGTLIFLPLAIVVVIAVFHLFKG